MKQIVRLLAVAAALSFSRRPRFAADNVKTHRIVFQVDQNDPAVMNLMLNNVSNILEYYHSKGEQAKSRSSPTGPGSTCCATTSRR